MYCDSSELENYWFYWILASASPSLETYREHGLLWTKVVGVAKYDGQVLLKKGVPLADPSYPERHHCLAFGNPIYFTTIDGKPQQNIDWCELEAALDLTSDAAVHALDEPLQQLAVTIPNLNAAGYLKEKTAKLSWHTMLQHIHRICAGISTRFKLQGEDEQQELASKAFLQVIEKLVSGRLTYLPGRAPVFNLLTTTTYRIMYSILNKQTHQRRGVRQLLDDAAAGVLPDDAGRSIRVPRLSKRLV